MHTAAIPTSASASGRETSCAGLVGAILEWSETLGPSHVLTSRDTIALFSRCTLPEGTTPAAILRPGSTAEVQQIVEIANRHHVALHPISRGKNWGYGDACAPTDGQAIVDLSRMDRILEVNADLAYAVIEPGVTQGQLATWLRDRGLPLWLDVTGAGPEASIVGNTLQRGFGHTPYGDHYAHMCGLEVVLRNGQRIQTGFGAFPNAQAGRVFPYGNGPCIDGLFTQSNHGIVTRMGLWLLREPEQCLGFGFAVHDESVLGDVVEALRELRLHDVVRSTVHIANDLRVISARQRYPWHLTGGVAPLPENVRQQLRNEGGIGVWNILGGLYGRRELVSAARKLVRRTFRPWGRVIFFDERKLKLAASVAGGLEWVGKTAPYADWAGRTGRRLAAKVDSITGAYALLRGIPTAEHLRGAAWRCRTPDAGPTALPVDCGLIWCSPVLPMTRPACDEVLAIVTAALTRHQFEPLITMSSINARALCCVASLCFDRTSPDEAARAALCHQELLQELAASGYYPYRGRHAAALPALNDMLSAGS